MAPPRDNPLDAAAKRRKAEKRGHRGEFLAALALRLKGWRIVARRFKTPSGKIDLIARRGDLIAIVEVKARASVQAAVDSVTRPAQRRIANAADVWLSRQRDHGRLSLRFDIVAVLPRRWPVHLEDAFRGD
ncbi:MAG TPA: YraN family protein [Rhizobiaceae bacterium]|nr:YraN family protein [Rhizobiaceae bacterium]